VNSPRDKSTGSSKKLLLLFLVLDLVVLFFGDIAYGTKDDVRILQLVSGTMLCGGPTEFVMYPNIAVGTMLKTLYESAAGIPWYFLTLSFLLLVSHLISIAVAASHSGKWAAWIVGIAFLPFFYQITFTVVSILLVFDAVLLLYHKNSQTNGTSSSTIYFIAGVMLLVSVLIRPETFFFALVVGGLSLLVSFGWRTFFKKMFPFLFFMALSGVAIHALDIVYYNHHPENANFAEYNKYKSFIIDFDVAEHADNFDEALKRAGWSRNDYEVFHRWLFMENDTFSLEKVHRFVESLNIEWDSKIPNVLDFYRKFIADPYLQLYLLFFMVCFIICIDTEGKRRLSYMLLFLTLLFIMITLATKEPPPRLYRPVIYFMFVMTVLYAGISKEKTGYRVFSAVVVSILVGLISLQLTEVNKRDRELHMKFVESLQPDRFYLSIDDALIPKGVDPRSDLMYLKNLKVVPFGTVVLISDVKKFMKKNGVSDYDDLLNIRVRLLVPQASTEKIELLKRYLLEHYGIDARDIEVENFNGLKIVHFTTSCHVTVPAS